MQQPWTKFAKIAGFTRGPSCLLICIGLQVIVGDFDQFAIFARFAKFAKVAGFTRGPLVFSFALASKLLSAILTNLPFFPDSPNSPALQGGPLVFSFALASKLLSAILTNLPFLPDSPNSPALQGGPLVFSFALASKLLLAKFCHFCHFCCCVHFWTYLHLRGGGAIVGTMGFHF